MREEGAAESTSAPFLWEEEETDETLALLVDSEDLVLVDLPVVVSEGGAWEMEDKVLMSSVSFSRAETQLDKSELLMVLSMEVLLERKTVMVLSSAKMTPPVMTDSGVLSK